MQLADIFEQLTYGELKQFSIGGFEQGGIQPENYPEVITHINMGMTALYAKFPIYEREVGIQQQEGNTLYELDSKYSVSAADPTVLNPYIIDTVEKPFLDDVMRIYEAYDELGEPLPLNDLDDDTSLFTPSYDSIQIPYPVATNMIFIVYRASHVNIPLDITDPSTVEVELPIVLQEALLSYVASRVHGSKTGDTGMQESLNLLAKYERICDIVEEKNLLRNANSRTSTRLEDNGWV